VKATINTGDALDRVACAPLTARSSAPSTSINDATANRIDGRHAHFGSLAPDIIGDRICESTGVDWIRPERKLDLSFRFAHRGFNHRYVLAIIPIEVSAQQARIRRRRVHGDHAASMSNSINEAERMQADMRAHIEY
jgi:hypothetical protein